MLSDRELIAHGYATFTLTDTLGDRDRGILAALVRGGEIKKIAASFGLSPDTIRNMPEVVDFHSYRDARRALTHTVWGNGHNHLSLREIAKKGKLGRERVRQTLGSGLPDTFFEVEEWIWTLPEQEQKRVSLCLYRWLVVEDTPHGYLLPDEAEQQRIAKQIAGFFLSTNLG
jgi:hypothetical protein